MCILTHTVSHQRGGKGFPERPKTRRRRANTRARLTQGLQQQTLIRTKPDIRAKLYSKVLTKTLTVGLESCVTNSQISLIHLPALAPQKHGSAARVCTLVFSQTPPYNASFSQSVQIGLQRERSPQPDSAKQDKTPTEQPLTSTRTIAGIEPFHQHTHQL